MTTEVSLAGGITSVLAAWQDLVARGEMSEQTLSRFGQLLHRFEAFAALQGTLLLADVTVAVAAHFIDAYGRTRHGHVAPASLSTRHLRRSVLRMCFTTAREIGLIDADPTRDLVLPLRVSGTTRALDEAEAVELRLAAQYTDRPTRHAAAAALALAGGFSGEIGHISVCDLDLARGRVWVHGSTKTTPRWCPLDAWGTQVLAARAEYLRQSAPTGQDPLTLRLAVSARNGTDEQIQARVCVALRDLLRRIGLGADATVRPASITAYAGWETFTRTGRIEAAAHHLGMSSLDSTAALIGHHWHANNTDFDAAGENEDRRDAR
jgi:integrase/recombinase XerC